MNKESKTEIKFNDFVNEKFNTIHGKKSILELNKLLGLPKLIFNYAVISVKASLKDPFMPVERVVSVDLFYNENLIIRDINKTFSKLVECECREFKKVRMENYNPLKPPKATKKEMSLYCGKVVEIKKY